MNPDRAAILLAFHDENEVLTKREILTRAQQSSDAYFLGVLAMKLLGQRDWQPNAPRQYFLTPAGRDKRDECVVGD